MQQLQQDLADTNQDEIATNRALLAIKKFKQSVKPEPKLSTFTNTRPKQNTTKMQQWPDTRYQGKSKPLPEELWSDSENEFQNNGDSDPDFHLNYSS